MTRSDSQKITTFLMFEGQAEEIDRPYGTLLEGGKAQYLRLQPAFRPDQRPLWRLMAAQPGVMRLRRSHTL